MAAWPQDTAQALDRLVTLAGHKVWVLIVGLSLLGMAVPLGYVERFGARFAARAIEWVRRSVSGLQGGNLWRHPIMIELNFPNEVSDEKNFYGRHMERERIEHTLTSGTGRAVIIQGERRIGKTSLQLVTARVAAARTSGQYVPLFLPPWGTMRSFKNYAREILQAFCSYLGKNWRETGMADEDGNFQFSSYGEFTEVLADLMASASGRTFILCVDELDSIMRGCADPGEAREVLALTDRLRDLGKSVPLVIFFTLTEVIGIHSFGSDLVACSEIISIGAFSLVDMQEMVAGLMEEALDIEPDAMRRIFELSAGHPYFTKLLLDRLLAYHPSGAAGQRLTQDMVDGVVMAAIQDPRASYAMQNIFEEHFNSAEQALALLVSGKELEVTSQTLQLLGPAYQGAAKALDRRGYLDLPQTDAAPCGFRIRLMGHWLRDWDEYEVVSHRLGLPAIRERFATEITIDEAREEVRVKGETRKLGPQQYDALLCLAQQVETVVSRDDLAQMVWGSAVATTEQNIDRVIFLLRRQLGDISRPPRYVETVVGKGFMLHLAVLLSRK